MKNTGNKHLLIVSYFAGKTGCCPAEWLDDKVDSYTTLGYKIVLISSLGAKKSKNPNVKHYRIPSISPTDLKNEILEIRSAGSNPSFTTILWLPLVVTMGILFDLLMITFTKGLGGGRISWTISSTICTFFIGIFNKIDIIFSTGGPASSHLAAVVNGLILRKPVILELQDPLVGNGIGRNSRSAMLLAALEKFIVRFSNKVAYVTQQAAREAQERYGTNNITCIYPGAKNYIEQTDRKQTNTNEKLRLVHLGTIYSTRNFNTLITAIDSLIESNQLKESEIELINLGDIYDFKDDYLKKSYFKQYPIRPREEAIKFAATSDINLIIQHTDPRSTTTIPYKTYDYLNIGRPILGLTNNQELSSMLKDYGHAAVDVNNPPEIAKVLIDLKMKKNSNLTTPKKIDAITQAKELITLQ